MKTHFEEFEEKARYFGVTRLLPLMPVSREVIRKALASGDIHLNTIPLELWDRAAGYHWRTAWYNRGGTSQEMRAPPGHIFYRSKVANSLADRVCLLKHIARYYFAPDSVSVSVSQTLKPRIKNMEKIEALRKFLELTPDDFEDLEEGFSDSHFEHGKREYLVLTDKEADEKAGEQIRESLWAFNASFLAGETGISQDVFEAIQKNDKCESNNPAIESIIKSTCGIGAFIETAIGADGRGHFLSSYDGEENEEGEFFIYRTN